MAETDELTVDLLPFCVLSNEPSGSSEHPAADIETLTREVVARGIREADARVDSAHAVVVERVEKELICQILEACGGVQTKAAARLGINRNTLHKKIKQYGIDAVEE